MTILSVVLILVAIILAIKIASKLVKIGAILFIAWLFFTDILPKLGILFG